MTPIATVVHSSTKQFTPKHVRVPGFAWNVFTLFHRIHQLWRWYNKAQIYANPNNFYSLTAGHVVNFIFGDNVLVRIAAQSVMIASRILKCINQTVLLSRACRKWVNAVKGNSASVRSKSKAESIYSMTEKSWIRASLEVVVERIKIIAIATFKLFKRMFVLSMHFMDAIEAFSISPATRNESINELFINGTVVLDEMVKNQRRLLDSLKENKSLVNHILNGIHSSFTAEKLITTVTKTLETATTINNVANAGGGIVKNIVQNATFGAAALIGLEKYLPKFLIPDSFECPFFKDDQPPTETEPSSPLKEE